MFGTIELHIGDFLAKLSRLLTRETDHPSGYIYSGFLTTPDEGIIYSTYAPVLVHDMIYHTIEDKKNMEIKGKIIQYTMLLFSNAISLYYHTA